MRSAAVGHQCVECVNEGARGIRQPTTAFGGRQANVPLATYVLIAINVAMFVAQTVAPEFERQFFLWPNGVAHYDQYYRLLTSGFLHTGITHIAFNMIAPPMWTKQRKQQARDRMSKLMDDAGSLSTQENLWLLLAFTSMIGAETTPELHAAQPAATVVSKNGRAAAWVDRKLENDLVIKGLNQSALTFLMQAEYSTSEVDTDRVDRGFRIERVVKNLTDATRVGTPNAPLKLGDQLLITYRLNTRKLQNFVALEDALPAGVEVVNPNLALVGKFYQLPPPDPQDRLLGLSYSEMRDRSALLYFDTVDPGSGTYSILARATAAGTFRWPATQVAPMYDSRFSGLSPSSVCVVSAD